MYAARASCLDLSSEIGEFDSVSQISCMDNHDRWHFIRINGSMSVSSDVLSGDDHSTMVSSHVAGSNAHVGTGSGHVRRHAQFPYAYLKSKLSTLPEELTSAGGSSGPGGPNNRLQYNKWNNESQETQSAATQSEVGSSSKHSGLAPSQRLKMLAIRRKKSQSLADLHDKSLGSLTSPVQEPFLIIICPSPRRVDTTVTPGRVRRRCHPRVRIKVTKVIQVKTPAEVLHRRPTKTVTLMLTMNPTTRFHEAPVVPSPLRNHRGRARDRWGTERMTSAPGPTASQPWPPPPHHLPPVSTIPGKGHPLLLRFPLLVRKISR